MRLNADYECRLQLKYTDDGGHALTCRFVRKTQARMIRMNSNQIEQAQSSGRQNEEGLGARRDQAAQRHLGRSGSEAMYDSREGVCDAE